MTYKQAIDFLYSKLPMFTRVGASAYKKDLTNILLLCEALNHPEKKFKSIHVGGTNGKGSVSHTLAAILQQAGFKTGLHTSPHLFDFRERIKINGQVCSETFVVDFVEKMQPSIQEIEPSFFELTVAMAFEWFAVNEVDIAIIEVGLGGRLDSTNIIHPELSIITNIGWDHMHLLGNTLEQIAFEKAGIIKPHTPVIIGETLQETKAVFIEQSTASQAPIYFTEDEIRLVNYQHHVLHQALQFEYKTGKNLEVITDLPGLYQHKNIASTLLAVEVLNQQGWTISENNIIDGLKASKQISGLRGRWEVLHQHPLTVADVAHNSNGIEWILKQVNSTPHNQLHIVIGMVQDKDVDKVLQLLPKDAHYYFTQAQIPRALECTLLQSKASAFNLNGAAYENVNLAISKAQSLASKDDFILICGSIFVIAEIEQLQPS